MSNEKKPFTWDKKKVLALLLLVLILGLVFAYRGSRVESIESIPSATEDNPKFVLASWDFPDEYGQGIEAIEVYENSTGSWVLVETYFYDDETNIDWNASVGIKLRCYTWFNSTLTGASDTDDGKNYQRHSVTVTLPNDTVVFSQQNFTYFYSDPIDPPMWYYGYDVVLNVLPDYAQTYTVTVDYEVFYELSEEEEYKHDCSSVTGITYQDNSNLGASDYGIGSDGDSVEFWILPDDALSEGVIYKLDFTNILNPDNDIKITVRYKIEGATNYFYYYIVYDDASSNYSSPGLSTTWANLVLTPELGKTLDYILLYNYDTPNGIASGNLSVWIDYIKIDHFFGEDWNTVSNLDLIFTTPILPPIPQWMFDTALIIMGMCMIPISTLYLAYGIKHDRTSERVFYGLMIFLLGWAFLIAGITP